MLLTTIIPYITTTFHPGPVSDPSIAESTDAQGGVVVEHIGFHPDGSIRWVHRGPRWHCQSVKHPAKKQIAGHTAVCIY